MGPYSGHSNKRTQDRRYFQVRQRAPVFARACAGVCAGVCGSFAVRLRFVCAGVWALKSFVLRARAWWWYHTPARAAIALRPSFFLFYFYLPYSHPPLSFCKMHKEKSRKGKINKRRRCKTLGGGRRVSDTTTLWRLGNFGRGEKQSTTRLGNFGSSSGWSAKRSKCPHTLVRPPSLLNRPHLIC